MTKQSKQSKKPRKADSRGCAEFCNCQRQTPTPEISTLLVTLLNAGYSDERAANIVRAVNVHQELVQLVKDLYDLTLSESGARTYLTLRVNQTLAKAEGVESKTQAEGL